MSRRKSRARGPVPQRSVPAAQAPQVGTGRSSAAAVNHYDSGGSGRRMRGWRPPPVGPNRALQNLPAIRNRSRDAGRNEWSAKAASTRWASNLVGTGILARPKTTDEQLRLKLARLWDDWTAECDAEGVLDLYGIQTQVAENWIEAGEVFVRLRWRRLADGLPAPLQLQTMESDMVPLLDADSGADLPRGHYVRSGIEFDAIGTRVAYWMHREHPGDGHGGGGIGLHDLRRVPAREVLHIFKPQRPGQLRGVSEFAGILPKLRGVGDFDDAVLERQKLANLFAMFVTESPADASGSGIDPVTGQPVEMGADGVPLMGLEPGTTQHLLPGQDVRFSEPPDAGANYADFMRFQHQHVAAGVNLPYELLTGDVRDVSDRTLRVIILEFRRLCQQRQWNILIPQFCRKVRRAWVQAAMLAGHLSAAEAIEANQVEWAPQGWDYLHPVQDVEARINEIRGGLRTRSAAILEKGDDPWEVDREMAADNQRADSLGLVLDSDPRTIGKGVRVSSATKDDAVPNATDE